MDIETLARGLHPLEIRVLRACPERGEAEEKQGRSEAGLEEGQCRRAVQGLLSKEIVAVVREEVVETIRLTSSGGGSDCGLVRELRTPFLAESDYGFGRVQATPIIGNRDLIGGRRRGSIEDRRQIGF